jgi:hypothetical protein
MSMAPSMSQHMSDSRRRRVHRGLPHVLAGFADASSAVVPAAEAASRKVTATVALPSA